jgi:hypothetical protein
MLAHWDPIFVMLCRRTVLTLLLAFLSPGVKPVGFVTYVIIGICFMLSAVFSLKKIRKELNGEHRGVGTGTPTRARFIIISYP